MSKPAIIEKLENLLVTHLPFKEEAQVVYFLVEAIKILDRDNNKKYPLIRFYRDWSVHTVKDKITPEIRTIMGEIYRDLALQLTNKRIIKKKTKIIGFMYMEDLQEELRLFFAEYGLPVLLVDVKENWMSFVTLLVKVLEDQEIIKPCKEISSFAFTPSDPECVSGIIRFTTKIGDYYEYPFGNIY